MDIELQPASISDKPVLRNLMELCQHDYSEYDGAEVDAHGLFGYEYLDNYWTEPKRFPFLIRLCGKLAGFVLVRTVDAPDKLTTHAITEFFVLRKYRRQGIGRQVAWQIFGLFPGQWSVCQEEGNRPAQSFWRRVIAEYTQGSYTDEILQIGKGLDDAHPEDLEAFVLWKKKQRKSVNSYLWAIHRHYEYTSNEPMRRLAMDMRQQEIAKGRGERRSLRLKDIPGVAAEQIEKLAAIGIADVEGVLKTGRTKEEREALSRRSGVPLASLCSETTR